MSKVALLFSGQGSQFIGMSSQLYNEFEVVRNTFEEAGDVLGFNLYQMCSEGDINELTKTENAQPAVLTSSVAAFRVYTQEIGAEPEFCAGHSLGEISALTCAGAIDFKDAVKLVNLRGKFMQEAVQQGVGAMSAVMGIARSLIEEECKKQSSEDNYSVIANYNSSKQIVISGHAEAVAKVSKELTAKGATVIPLKVSAPFHCGLMKPAAVKFKEELTKYSFNDPVYTVISNVSAKPYNGKEEIIENLYQQIFMPVQWEETVKYLKIEGVTYAVELGPKAILKKLVKDTADSIGIDVLTDKDCVGAIKNRIMQNGQESTPAREEKLKLITKCISIAVCTRNRNWNNSEYEEGVIKPYRKVKEMLEVLEKEGREPSLEDMRSAIDMLKSVFETKQTPEDERVERFNEIFTQTNLRHLFPGI